MLHTPEDAGLGKPNEIMQAALQEGKLEGVAGIGIPPEYQARLFQAFAQVNAPRRPEEGTGLGLHLSQKLAALLGGHIEFESEYGKGSTFAVVLPQG